MPIALIRNVSSSIQRCELTHMTRERVDLDRARSQHTTYAHALAELGCQVKYLPELNDHPDAVFVEDTVVVVPEIAVLTNPGARSRRGPRLARARVVP